MEPSDPTEDPMKRHRSARFVELLSILSPDLEEARRLFKQKTGYSKGRVTQLEREGFGERSGIEVAKRLGLKDERWFEQPAGTPIKGSHQPALGVRRAAEVAEPAATYAVDSRNGGDHAETANAWPFSTPRELFDSLPPETRSMIDGYIKGVADARENKG